jgi:hypothetical protein
MGAERCREHVVKYSRNIYPLAIDWCPCQLLTTAISNSYTQYMSIH